MLCEDTRRTRKLLTAHGIRAELPATTSTTRQRGRHRSCHASRRARGSRSSATRACRASAIPVRGSSRPPWRRDSVTVLPGPRRWRQRSSPAGFAFDRYQFLGYLPRRGNALETLFRELESWPHARRLRVPATASALARRPRSKPPGPRRRRLPRADESLRGGRARRRTGRGCTVLDPGEGGDHDRGRAGLRRQPVAEPAAVAAVAELVGSGVSRRQAADVIARLTGASRNSLYRDSL